MTARKRTLIFAACFSLLVLAAFAGAEEDGPQADLLSVIVTPSPIGTVSFPHELHFSEMEMECATCHHEVNARTLEMPHPEYFNDFWIDCGICHGENSRPAPAQACSNCHHCPLSCSDETLSPKVVIHKSCWACHESGEGEEASRSCEFCHSGPKIPY